MFPCRMCINYFVKFIYNAMSESLRVLMSGDLIFHNNLNSEPETKENLNLKQ